MNAPAESFYLSKRRPRMSDIGDREADIFELFWTAQQVGTHFMFRTCVDRCAEDGTNLVEEIMQEVPCKGLRRIDVRDKKGNARQAILELRYRRIKVLPSRAKQNRYQPLTLTVLHAMERHAPKGTEAIRWKLVTDLPVCSRAEALEKLQWYALRWKIEIFHKIMKSGCKAEESKLRNCRAAGKSHGNLLHPELAHILDDHVESIDRGRASKIRAHATGGTVARSSRGRQGHR